MKKSFLPLLCHILMGLAMLFLFPCSVLSQSPPADMPPQGVSLEWARRFDNQAKGEAQVNLAAIDAEGSVYLIGTSTSTGRKEFVTVKFSSSGEELWAVRRTSDGFNFEAKAIAVDNAGGLYITGYETDGNGQQYMITISYNTSTGAENWTRHYISEDEWGYSEGRAIVTDGSGGVYVTGLSTAYTGADIVTIRYEAATGAESWVSRYNAKGEEWSWEDIRGIALDGAGGVYIAGVTYGDYTSADFVVLRYDAATGSQSWASLYNGETGPFGEEPYDEVKAIVADGAGGVYVTGITVDFTTYLSDFITIRFETNTGEMSWVSHYNGTGDGEDIPKAIATDGAGGVYVTGTTFSATGSDYATIRYDAASGAESWVSLYDGGGHEWAYEEGRSITTDGQGGVYVTGRAEGPSSGPDFGTIRYDAATGAETWSKHYNGGSEEWTWDEASVILLDQKGGVKVIGSTNGSMGSYAGNDYTVVHYEAATGEEIWASRYEGLMMSTDDIPISIVVDKEGNTYVTGRSLASNSYSSVMVTIKYSPSGDELWVSQYKEGISNYSVAIALDQAGGVYITGVSEDWWGYEIVSIRYDAATGEQDWVRRYGGKDGEWSLNLAQDITTDEAGGVFVTGFSYGNYGTSYTTIRYDALSGEESWVSLYSGPEEWANNEARAIIADGAGGVYVTGVSWSSTGPEMATIRYEASSGEMSWVSRNENGEGIAIALDDAGGVFVTGNSYVDGNSGFLTIRYDAASGMETWEDYFIGIGGEEDWSWKYVKGITADHDGGVFVTGTHYGSPANAYVTIRYDATSGTKNWERFYTGENEWGWVEASAIATDGAGGVYVTGVSSSYNYSSVFATVKYRAEDGAQEWVIQTEGPYDGAVDLALDAMNNVYVTGYSLGWETGMDFLTVKYNQTQCVPSAVLEVSGDRTVSVGTSQSVYSLSGAGADSYLWSISGDQYVSFSGQGTSEISVNWPDHPGVYKLSLTYSNGCSSHTATAYVFVSDPAAGFVTGGGWIHSPISSEYELMQEGGKATFSLNAKYKKDGQIVEGHLQLKAPSFRFEASMIENQSLVIAGTKAYFTGQGSLSRLDGNNKESQDPRKFGFLLSVTDGNFKAKSGTDHFRLIIWELNSDLSQGMVVYDNQFSCSPAILDHHLQACNPIGKGNITIHKGKEKARLASTEELPMPEKFSVYPVPFANQLNLQHEIIKKDVLVLVALIGADGKSLDVSDQIVAQADGYLKINLERLRLTNGLYILRVETAGESPVFQRVIAQQ